MSLQTSLLGCGVSFGSVRAGKGRHPHCVFGTIVGVYLAESREFEFSTDLKVQARAMLIIVLGTFAQYEVIELPIEDVRVYPTPDDAERALRSVHMMSAVKANPRGVQ